VINLAGTVKYLFGTGNPALFYAKSVGPDGQGGTLTVEVWDTLTSTTIVEWETDSTAVGKCNHDQFTVAAAGCSTWSQVGAFWIQTCPVDFNDGTTGNNKFSVALDANNQVLKFNTTTTDSKGKVVEIDLSTFTSAGIPPTTADFTLPASCQKPPAQSYRLQRKNMFNYNYVSKNV